MLSSGVPVTAGPDDPVTIPDAVLRSRIEDALRKSAGATITEGGDGDTDKPPAQIETTTFVSSQVWNMPSTSNSWFSFGVIPQTTRTVILHALFGGQQISPPLKNSQNWNGWRLKGL